MAAYKQTTTWHEDGFGTVYDVFIVADSYAATLDLAAATEVGVFQVDATNHDLDLKAGSFIEDELSFSMAQTTVENAEDAAAIEFVLAALDETVPRFCARYLMPHDPPEEADVEFRGMIRPEMSAEDVSWDGVEYSGDVAPIRVWDCTARPYALVEFLDYDLKEAVAAIEPEWIEDNVADRLGYFRTLASGGRPLREAKYGDLVAFQSLIQKLIDIATPDGLTATFTASYSDMIAWLGLCRASRQGTTSYRYFGYAPEPGSTDYRSWQQARHMYIPYGLPVAGELPEPFQIQVGGAPEAPGSLYVNWRLLAPSEADGEDASWLRYSSVAELLYELAAGFGMFVEYTYDSATEVGIRFKARSEMGGGAVTFIRDATAADIDTALLDPDAADKYTGISQLAGSLQESGEGISGYDFSRRSRETLRDNRPPIDVSDYRMPPLTVSPTPVGLVETSLYDGAMHNHTFLPSIARFIPHNVVYYNDGVILKRGYEGELTIPEDDTRGLHTAMYVCTEVLDGIEGWLEKDLGDTDPLKIWLPVLKIYVDIGGQPRVYGVTSEEEIAEYEGIEVPPSGLLLGYKAVTRGMADYLNDLYQSELAYYETEYTVDVPYICGFKPDPGDPADWRHCQLGNLVTLDGVVYVIVGIERGKTSTTLKLHNGSRFALQPVTPVYEGPGEMPELPSYSVDTVLPLTPGYIEAVAVEDLAQFQLVRLQPTGGLQVALPVADHYGTVLGVALAAAAAGEVVRAQLWGQVFVGTDFSGIAVGARLFLRKPATTGAPNISDAPLAAWSATEDMALPIGMKLEPEFLYLAIGEPVVYIEP